MEVFKRAFQKILMFLLIFDLSLLPAIVHAGALTVDNQAQYKNRPSLDKAQNDVPIVNLAAPSSKGVSHNKFSDYNVDKIGLILNNSKSMGTSKLGGSIYGNPNYQKSKEASIVLNEVTGSRRSNLLGYTEMFGKSAEFILANPNGITCNGCGFINMPRVTLGSGRAVLDDIGNFRGLNIGNGSIVVEDLGLDGSEVDYFDIVTRMAEINAGIWAKNDLNFKTGTGFYDYTTKNLEQKDIEGERPEFSIDASALVKIYSGRITIVGNESGVGVRSNSDMLADAGNIEISADGKIELKNVQAKEDIKVSSNSSDIKQNGEAVSEGSLEYRAKNTIQFEDSYVEALKEVSLESEETNIIGSDIIAGLIEEDENYYDFIINTLNFKNDANSKLISNKGSFVLNSETVENKGVILSYEDLNIEALAGVISNDEGQIEASQNISINSGEGTFSNYLGVVNLFGEDGKIWIYNAADIDNNAGSITSRDEIQIDILGDITLTDNNIGKVYADNYFNLNAKQVYNDMDLEMDGSIDINASMFENYDSRKITSNKLLKIESENEIINQGSLSGEDISIKSINSYIDNQNLITGGDGQTAIEAAGDINNSNRISSANDLYLTGYDLINNGEISSNNVFTANVNSVLNKENKLLFSGGDMIINALDYIDNKKGAYIYSLGSMKLQENEEEKSNRITNYAANIESAGDMFIYTNNLENIGEDSGAYDITDTYRGGYGNGYYALMQENVVTSTMETDSAYIKSGIDLTINAEEVYNHGSFITSNNNLVINAGTFNNETDSQNVYLDQYKYYGKHWTKTEEWYKDWSLKSKTYHYYDNYWSSGDILIYSANHSLVQAGESLAVNASEVGNEAVNYDLAANSISDKSSNVVYNTSNIDDIKETGSINVLDYIENQSALFTVNEGTKDFSYLIETNSKLINTENLKGSEYLLERLGFTPEEDVKLLGDAFYEQKLINESILKSTSNMYLKEDLKSETEQMQWLLENAVSADKNLNLSVGIELTKEQINSLEGPIIWLVEKEVMGQKVLVPDIYIPEHIIEGFSKDKGSKIKADSIYMDVENSFANSGLIESNNDLFIEAGSILNESTGSQAKIKGGYVSLNAKEDIINKSGLIQGEDILSLKTETGDIINETLVYTQDRKGDIISELGFEAGIVSNGDLYVDAGRDFTNKAAMVKSSGSASIEAENNINFETVKLRNKTNYTYGDGYAVSDTTTSIGSNLDIGSSLLMNSGKDINFVGSTAEIKGSAEVNAGGNFNLLNDYNTSYYESQRTKKGFLKSKTTTIVKTSKTVVDSVFNVGGQTEINADQDINIVGSKSSFNEDASLNAENQINILSVHDEYYYKKDTKKSGLFTGGSLWGSEKTTDINSSKIVHSSVAEIKGNFASNSGSDTNIVGSILSVDETAEIQTGGDFNLIAGYDENFEEHSSEKGGFLSSSGNLYEKEIEVEGKGSKTAVASILNAGNLVVKSENDTLIEGSQINADNAYFETEGNFIETSAKEESYEYSFHEKTTMEISGLLEGALEYKEGRLSYKIGEGKYDKEKNRTDKTTQKSSELNISNQLVVDSSKNIIVAGSDINAGGDVILQAEENVDITTTEETTKTSSEETHGTAEFSIGVKHQATEVYYAAKGLKESTEKLKQATEDYNKYKDSLAKAEEDYKKGIIDKEDLDDIREDEKYYTSNIALLTADVTAKTKSLTQTAVASTQSSGTFGFNFDMQMDIDALIEKSLSIETTSKGSNINTGSNLIISAGNNAQIKGSNIQALQDIDIEADEVNILASRNTNESSSDSKHSHLSVTYALHGGLSADASADYTNEVNKSSSYTNSHLNSSNINIRSNQDTNIQGAVVKAEDSLNLEVGGSLKVESLQNSEKSKSYTIGASAGYSDNTSADGNFSISNGKTKWVEEQTQLLGGDNVSITVQDKTSLKGSLISSNTNNLTLDTGSLEYEDIKDKDRSTSFGGGAGSDGFENASFGFTDKRQTNKATIGEGEIIIRDNPIQDLSDLNRKTELSQHQVKDTGVSLSLDKAALDVMLNPVQTVKDIEDDLKQINENVEAKKQKHYMRNQFNVLISSIDEAEREGWEKMPDNKSIYHRMGEEGADNIKYISPDGHSEIIFNSDGSIVTDEVNKASYNFSSPNDFLGVPHVLEDVLPYFIWGNSEKDPTNFFERIRASYKQSNKKLTK